MGEAFALPRVSEERSSDAPMEAIDDTAELANRIIAAAELGDAEAMEELSATARRMIGSASTTDVGAPPAGRDRRTDKSPR